MPGLITAGSKSPQEGRLQNYVLLFHDQSHDTVPTAKRLLTAARQSRALQDVVYACSTSLRRRCTTSDSLHDFTSIDRVISFGESKKGEHAAVTSSVLSTFNQFCYLALLWEQHQSCFTSRSSRISSIGLCTGAVAAAASLFISSHEDVQRLASELIAVAYRLGLEADRRSDAIDATPESWSLALKNISEAEARAAVSTYNQQNELPSHHCVYVSAIMPNSLTVSGPPSTLKAILKQKNVFGNARHKLIPIYGVFHASHLICPDLDHIIGDARLSEFKRQPNRNLAFPDLANTTDAESLPQLVRLVIRNSFQNELSLRHAVSPISHDADLSTFRLVSMGEAGHAQQVQEWLCGSRQIQELDLSLTSDASQRSSHDLAVVGYAGRFPQAENLDEFWDVIVSGRDVHEYIPKDRFDALRHYDNTAKGKNTTASPYGCFMRRPGAFDNTFFNLSPRESLSMDPTQRLLLMVTQEALEMAGYSKSAVAKKRIGTFFGQATDDWRESHSSQNIDIFYVGGGMRAFAPGRLNYHYKWEGPSYSVDTACSSSLAALEFATLAVQSGDCDIAVAGGGNIISALPMFSGLSKGRFTSSTGSCKTFDAAADGYCRGEGVGVVVIKRLEDALAENDNIKGLVSGISTNHSAYAHSITHPHAGAQSALMRKTLSNAGVQPEEIDYIEFHGTGTQAGDACELASVSDVFGDFKKRQKSLYIGAVKANVGHGEAAAGITSLIKALLMLKHDIVPPHVGIKAEANPALLQGKASHLVVPREAVSFDSSRDDSPRRILINNFNATGGNTSMLLTSYDTVSDSSSPSASFTHYPITISAQSRQSLRGNLTALRQYVSENPSISLADLSYTTTARRQHFQYRNAFVVDSIESLSKAIEESLESVSKPVATNNAVTKVFAFAGQGTQTQGVAADLYQYNAQFRETLTNYNELCVNLGYPPFLDFVTDPNVNQEWTDVQLQLGVVAVEVALARLWQSLGARPDVVIGHSLGEYSALHISGVLSLADTFYLVGERAKLMQKHCKPRTQAMLSITQSAKDVEQRVRRLSVSGCGIACYNTDEAVVLAGPIESLKVIEEDLKKSSVKCKLLDVRYAFHSSMMDPILTSFRSLASKVPFARPRIPVASTLLASVVTEKGIFDAEYLANQCRQPVNYAGALKAYQDYVDDPVNSLWIELGAGNPACLPLIRGAKVANDRSRLITSFDTASKGWEVFLKSLRSCHNLGVDIEWIKLFNSPDSELNKAMFKLLDLPHYAFELQDFWFPSQPPSTEQTQKVSHVPRQRLGQLLHYLEYAQTEEQTAVAEFSSELADEELYNAIRGHNVFGAALCPSSVYSAMALEAATYLYENQVKQNSPPEFEVYDMSIHSPLIVSGSTEATLNVSASFNFKDSIITVSFASTIGENSTAHAHCKLRLSTADAWRLDWSKVDFLVKSRADTVTTSTNERLNKLNRAVIYKLFAHVVDYDAPYHGIKSITLDNESREAAAEIGFASSALGDAEQMYDNHLLDTLIHVSGFVLNNGIDDTQFAYISDGWDALMVPRNLKKGDSYTCYTHLAPSEDHRVYSGDVFLLSGSKVVAACTGLRFSRMTLKSLRSFVSKYTQGTKSGLTIDSQISARTLVASTPGTPLSKASSERAPRTADPVGRAVKIISEESGVSMDKLSDDAAVQDIGLDSILVTQVVDCLKSELGIEISADIFTTTKTIGELKSIFAALSSVDSSRAQSVSGRPVNSHSDNVSEASEQLPPPAMVNGTHDAPADRSSNLGDIFRDIIASEAGVAPEAVDSASYLGEIGLDSLLSSEVLTLVHQKTGKEYPASFLKDNVSMKAIRRTLSDNCKHTSSPRMPPAPASSEFRRQSVPKANNTKLSHTERVSSPMNRECRITFLQGDKKSSRPPLILFPPGMGTTEIYMKIPKNPNNTPMYALRSPFFLDGMNEDFNMDTAITAYLVAVAQVCPSGPLHLGGWSIGGALAYEAARRLLASGRRVMSLVIIDVPLPPQLLDTPRITFEALEMMGYNDFTRERHGTFPRNLTEHVIGAMNAFRTYVPRAMPKNQRPRHTRYISATHGSQEKFMSRAIASQTILNELSDEDGNYDMAKARQMLDERSPDTGNYVDHPKIDPSATGWEALVGNDLDIKIVEADHINLLLEDEPMSQLGKHLNSIV